MVLSRIKNAYRICLTRFAEYVQQLLKCVNFIHFTLKAMLNIQFQRYSRNKYVSDHDCIASGNDFAS